MKKQELEMENLFLKSECEELKKLFYKQATQIEKMSKQGLRMQSKILSKELKIKEQEETIDMLLDKLGVSKEPKETELKEVIFEEFLSRAELLEGE